MNKIFGHKNARLTPTGRALLNRVLVEGYSVPEVSPEKGVRPRTITALSDSRSAPSARGRRPAGGGSLTRSCRPS